MSQRHIIVGGSNNRLELTWYRLVLQNQIILSTVFQSSGDAVYEEVLGTKYGQKKLIFCNICLAKSIMNDDALLFWQEIFLCVNPGAGGSNPWHSDPLPDAMTIGLQLTFVLQLSLCS